MTDFYLLLNIQVCNSKLLINPIASAPCSLIWTVSLSVHAFCVIVCLCCSCCPRARLTWWRLSTLWAMLWMPCRRTREVWRPGWRLTCRGHQLEEFALKAVLMVWDPVCPSSVFNMSWVLPKWPLSISSTLQYQTPWLYYLIKNTVKIVILWNINTVSLYFGGPFNTLFWL